MKFPKEIKIGGHFYQIIFPYVFTERSDRCADIDHEKKVIRISAYSYDEERTHSTIIVSAIHEVLHGIDDQTGHGMFKGTNGEARMEALSEGIYQVLIDNEFLNRKTLISDNRPKKRIVPFNEAHFLKDK